MKSIVEKISFSPTLSIWKSSFDITNKEKLLLECEEVIRNELNVNTDGYVYYKNNGLKYDNRLDIQIKSELDLVMSSGINACIELYDNIFNEIKTDVWINVVRAKNPIQKKYKVDGSLNFHSHFDLKIYHNQEPPLYSFICYIQMPNNLINDDGVLFLQDIDKTLYSILPNEGDIIIIKSDLQHVPNYALNSTVDRIVLAGNVRMDFSKINKTLI